MEAENETGEEAEDLEEAAVQPDLEEVLAERDQLIDQLQRSVAEFQNYRRRNEADRFRLKEIASQEIIRSILPIMDDLQRALATVPDDQKESALVSGISAIERKFAGVLERNGVSAVGAIGDEFDPARHEAVATDESGAQTHIVEIYQTGYRQGDTTLRPAMVKVGLETVFNA